MGFVNGFANGILVEVHDIAINGVVVSGQVGTVAPGLTVGTSV